MNFNTFISHSGLPSLPNPCGVYNFNLESALVTDKLRRFQMPLSSFADYPTVMRERLRHWRMVNVSPATSSVPPIPHHVAWEQFHLLFRYGHALSMRPDAIGNRFDI